MQELEDLANDTDKRLSIHEAICAERYAGIRDSFDKGVKRMQRVEWLLYVVAAFVLLGPGVAAEFVKKFLEH